MAGSEKIKILYVDDEVNNLNGFKASFRLDYTIFIAPNTDDALKHLQTHADIRLILCDQRMPDKTGVQFFEEIRDTFPLPVRMLITGYTDIESVIDAVNKGNIFRYIKKPWTDDDVKLAIEEANKYYVTNSLLAIKNAELQLAYNELDKFAYSVTHDMRGPLMSILGAISVSKEIDDINELRDMLGMMEKSVLQLDDFIKGMHEYYNLKRGQQHINIIDFAKLTSDLTDIYTITGTVDGTNFISEITQNEPFKCDEMTLRIVLNNLLTNAFKYQRKNIADKFVKLSVVVEKGIATITVSDNGIGIQENHLAHIFNMFYRATSESIGSGFGLYNVKDAVAKMSGEISVSSIYNEGSTFIVVIPGK